MKVPTEKENISLLNILKSRFKKNMHRHQNLDWSKIEKKLKAHPEKFHSLHEMEKTGGEPDVVEFNNNKISFIDCTKESPKDRRSLCYDKEALDSRKANKPKNSAMEMAQEMGVEMLTEEEYKKLQEFEEFDLKTSSWILTPDKVRKLGGAIFADRRYDQVFVYHNGAESYYASRGFRGILKI